MIVEGYFLIATAALGSFIAPIVSLAGDVNGVETSVRLLLQSSVPTSSCKSETSLDGRKETSIGLWAIAEYKSPVRPAANKRIYEEIVSSLLRFKPKCVNVIDSVGIGIISDHLQKSGALDDAGGNVLAALSQAHQNVDIVVFPELISQSGKVLLSLRAVERASGKTVGLTTPILLPPSIAAADTSDTAMSLDEAIKEAARKLLQTAPDLKEIEKGGFFYESTQAQPAAARFLQEQMLSALVEQGANPVTGRVIKTRGISIEAQGDAEISAADLDADAVARQANVYALSGRYWIVDDALDLKITMRRPDGATIGWSGRIRLADLKQLGLRPDNSAAIATPLPQADYSFQVTTPRGSAPTYAKGEPLQLLVRAGRPAWLYCFYVDSKGGVQPIYPLPPKLFEGRTNHIEASKLVRIPDPKFDHFKFRITDNTVGEEMASCFSTLRDVRNELPPSLFPDAVSNIAFLTLDTVRQSFAVLQNAHVSEGLVTITITQ